MLHTTIDKTELFMGIQRVIGVVSKGKDTLPVLSTILVQTSGEYKLTLTGTNLETAIETTITAAIRTPGDVAIPAHKLFEIVRELPNEPVEMSVGENYWLDILCGKATFHLSGMTPKDFPAIQEIPGETEVVMDVQQFKMMVQAVACSVSSDASRHALTGIDLSITPEWVRLVSTDGHRLSFAQGGYVSDPIREQVRECIVPLKAMQEAAKIAERQIMIALGESLVAFHAGDTVIYTRMIDGNFPDYMRVIPKETSVTARVRSRDFMKSLCRVALLTSNTRLVKCDIQPDEIVLSANDPTTGEAHDVCACESIGTVTTGINAKYLQDVLGVMSCDRVVVSTSDALSPLLIVPEDADDLDLKFVIMPMRINEK